MAKFFPQFPKIQYNLSGKNGNTNVVTDIFRRVKIRSKIADNVSLLDKYDVAEGEKPEDIAYKIYGDTDYFWVVTLVNNIVNRYYDWPLPEFVFQQYLKDKYSNPVNGNIDLMSCVSYTVTVPYNVCVSISSCKFIISAIPFMSITFGADSSFCC